MNELEDLTGYGDGELSLRVFNDEGLYEARHQSDLLETLNECFTFTETQWQELEQDLENDKEETEQ